MTTLSTQPCPHGALEGLFSPSFIRDLFSDLDSPEAPYNVKSIYPYDLMIIKDADGEVEKFQLNFALSGFSEEDVSVKIINDELKIEVENERKSDASIDYVHQGIAHRAMKVNFKIGSLVDKENIAMKFKNGLLMIDIPIKPKETYTVKFN